MLKSLTLLSALTLLAAGSVHAADTDIVGAPGVIPHPVDSYLPITGDKNSCLMCHQNATSAKRNPTEIPLTHIKDGKVTGDRWNCTICHAPSVPAEVGDKK